ncbi:hypothetical protein NKG05_23315 [Oerskovia sp. M15]
MSHAAPSRHFSDKSKLLDALAIEGFTLLGTRLRDAARTSTERPVQADAAARAFIGFATTEANLTEVMFRHDDTRDASTIGSSAFAALQPIQDFFAEQDDESAATAATVFLATLQGIASLVNCGVVPAEHVPALITDALPRFFPAPSECGDRA